MARNGARKDNQDQDLRIYIIHGPAEYEEARHLRDEISQLLHMQATLTEDIQAKPRVLAGMRRELQRADIIIALLTPLSVKAPGVLEQVGGAWVLKKRIIPVITAREVLNGAPESIADSPLVVEARAGLDAKARRKVIDRLDQVIASALISA